MYRGNYVYMLNNVIAAVSDGSKDEARAVLKHLMNQILDDDDKYYYRRLVDDLMMNWYDTYKRDGKGVYMPRQVAGLPPRKRE